MTASFSYIYILQGSVAKQLRYGGIFNNHFTEYCPESGLVKNFENQLIFREDILITKCDIFWRHSVYTQAYVLCWLASGWSSRNRRIMRGVAYVVLDWLSSKISKYDCKYDWLRSGQRLVVSSSAGSGANHRSDTVQSAFVLRQFSHGQHAMCGLRAGWQGRVQWRLRWSAGV